MCFLGKNHVKPMVKPSFFTVQSPLVNHEIPLQCTCLRRSPRGADSQANGGGGAWLGILGLRLMMANKKVIVQPPVMVKIISPPAQS
jgi:hypothetical protein